MSHAIINGDHSWFKQLFESSPDPTWIIGGNRFVECNEAAIKTLGYKSRDEFLNVHPSKLSPPKQPDGEDSYVKGERMMALAIDKGLHRFEWMHTKADGMNFSAEVTLSAIELRGRPVIYCVWRDMTERKRTEAALRENEYRWKFAIEGTGAGILDWNIPTGEMKFSDRWLEMTGYSCDELAPGVERLISLVHPEDLPLAMADMQMVLEGSKGVHVFEHRLKHKQGHWIWIQSRSMVSARGDRGEPLRMIGTHIDITERKQAEDLTKERNALLMRQKIELEQVLSRVKRLEGLLSICMQCKKIRTENNDWHQLEQYIGEHSDAVFSHGLCPDCLEKEMKKLD